MLDLASSGSNPASGAILSKLFKIILSFLKICYAFIIFFLIYLTYKKVLNS